VTLAITRKLLYDRLSAGSLEYVDGTKFSSSENGTVMLARPCFSYSHPKHNCNVMQCNRNFYSALGSLECHKLQTKEKQLQYQIRQRNKTLNKKVSSKWQKAERDAEDTMSSGRLFSLSNDLNYCHWSALFVKRRGNVSMCVCFSVSVNAVCVGWQRYRMISVGNNILT